SYGKAIGWDKGRITHLHLDRDGALWIASPSGLSRLKSGHLATLTSKNGLPCDGVDWLLEGDADTTWLYTSCGLVRVARSELVALADAAGKGDDAERTIHTMVLDDADGIRSAVSVGTFSPHVARSADGKLWLIAPGGVTVVDPQHLPRNALPPSVIIEQV